VHVEVKVIYRKKRRDFSHGKKGNIFLGRAVDTLLIACCVTHLYVLNFIEQKNSSRKYFLFVFASLPTLQDIKCAELTE
jgi:hypothetical protein